jgi:hypothetical protein
MMTQPLYLLFNKALQRKCNNHTEAICPDLTATHIIIKPEASPSRPTTSQEHKPVQQTHSAGHRMRSPKSSPPSPRTHLQDRDPCIDLVKPAIDTTTAPDSVASLRACRDTVAPCHRDPPRSTRYKNTAPPSYPLQTSCAPKKCPQEGKRHQKYRHRPILD